MPLVTFSLKKQSAWQAIDKEREGENESFHTPPPPSTVRLLYQLAVTNNKHNWQIEMEGGGERCRCFALRSTPLEDSLNNFVGDCKLPKTDKNKGTC